MNGKKAMLIVGDVETNRAVIAVSFSSAYAILTAENGAEAMAAVRGHGADICMILLDEIMPGMDGIAFLQWLSASEHRCIPVIAVTSDESHQLEALKNGAWDFIAKPLTAEVIKARVNNVLGRYAFETERRQNEALTKAKIEMDNLINSIPGGIAMYKVTDRFETLFFSDGVASLSGHTREEYARWTKQDASVTIYEQDKARVLDAAMETAKNGKPIDEVYRVYHKDGSLAWVHLNGVLIGEEGGAPILHAVFQKPSRMAQLYNNLVNESKSVIYVSDIHNYDLLYINQTGLRVIGKDAANYASKKCYEVLFGRSAPCPFCKIDSMSATCFLERDYTYERTNRTYTMRGKLMDWNGIPAHVEYAQDVTEIRKAEQQNAALTKQLQSIMENIPGGMCVYRVDRDGLHPMVHNQAFFDIFGYSPQHRQAVLEKTNFLNVHPDDLGELQRKVNQAIAADATVRHTYRAFSDVKNCYIWLNLNAVIVPQPNGEKLCYVSYTDVTDERATQEKLIQTQKVLEELQQQARDTLDNYQALVNAVPGGIAQYEIQGTKVLTRYFSDGICQLTGCTREEREKLCNQDVLSVTYEEDIPMLSAAIQKAVSKQENVNISYRIYTKSGVPRWVHLSAAYSMGKHGETLYQAVFTDVDKLKRIEQQLQENQLRYEVAIKSSGINIWEYDIEADSLYVISNSSRIKQNCFHIDHYVESTLQQGYVREESIPRFLSIFERLRQGVEEVTEDIWYKTTDEAGWWCERVTYTTMFDQLGKPTKAFGAGRDVTREKDAEKKFREEISYRKAIQSDNLASIVIDLTNNQVVEINSEVRAVLSLADASGDEYFEKTRKMITGESNRRKFAKQFNRKALLRDFSSGEYLVAMELTRLYDTNRVYWINYNVHLIQNPENKNVVAHISCVDITEEKVMQTIMETVAQTDYDFFVVVDGATDSAKDYADSTGRQLYDEDQSFERQNEVWVRSCVCPEDVERVVAACKIDAAWEQVKNGQPYKFSFSMRALDGTIRRKQMQLTAISADRRTYLMSRIDITNIYEEQEAAKIKLQKALLDAKQANLVKTDFLSRMSHDIRTPMNAVISLAELGQESASLAEAQEALQKIGTSGQYLLAIINDVLSLSKMEHHGLELHPEVVCLPRFIQDTLSIVMPTAKEKQIDLQVTQTGIASQYMKMDVTYVRQVAVNLLSNAIKFTPSGGRVDLILENISRAGRFVTNRMLVKDTGIGIGSEFLTKIFSPFEQENTRDDPARQGTGLGLSIVKQIVEQMGGRIWVESEKGRGSTFFVEWTLESIPEAEVQPPLSAPVSQSRQSLAGKRVLLAEDHPLNAEIAKKLLEKEGMRIEHVPNGQAAVEQFSASLPGYYDAILMDIRMPVMDGLEAARTIRRLNRRDAKSIPIIAMTANAFDEDVQISIHAGMNAHLAKPIDRTQLYDTLARLIKGKAEQR